MKITLQYDATASMGMLTLSTSRLRFVGARDLFDLSWIGLIRHSQYCRIDTAMVLYPTLLRLDFSVVEVELA